jgi:hypothetical protein
MCGEVRSVGSFRITTGTRVFQAVVEADPLFDSADLRSVFVLRQRKDRSTVDATRCSLVEMIDTGNVASDLELESDDIVLVPKR